MFKFLLVCSSAAANYTVYTPTHEDTLYGIDTPPLPVDPVRLPLSHTIDQLSFARQLVSASQHIAVMSTP